jgi:hypothetical protein
MRGEWKTASAIEKALIVAVCMLSCALIILLSTTIWLFIDNINVNTNQIASDIDLIKKLNYKVCVRINDIRGVERLILAHYPTPTKHESIVLASDLPMYVCKPYFTDGAKIFTPAQEKAYIETLVKGKKPGP